MGTEDCVVKYRFRDTDITGWEEYDIEGDEYSALIDVCIEYSDAVSFELNYSLIDSQFLSKIEKFLIRKIERSHNGAIHFYATSPEVASSLKKVCNSIFSWVYTVVGAEDLTFYRNDGSVFFESVTHDGICDLLPRKNENISHIFSKGEWEKDPEPITYDLTPKTAEWGEEHTKYLYRIKEEKYQEFLNRLSQKLSAQKKSDKDFLKSCEDILKIADHFGYSVDKVVEDFLR
jgi:hypothetical protein